ncbi:MAG: GNAT family N-acetyltransferase [Patescibacteria group bacterium]
MDRLSKMKMEKSQSEFEEREQPEVEVEVFDSQTINWEMIKEDVLQLEREAFGEKGFTEEDFIDDFKNNAVVVLMRAKNARPIIGLTYAVPIGVYYPERKSESSNTAIIGDTIITKTYRGKRLVGRMMFLLEDALRKRGYQYLERSAMIANHYAENVEKNYQDRIVHKEGPRDSFWGPQMFFKIKL